MSARLKSKLLDEKTLDDWKAFSVSERLRIIQRVYNFKMSSFLLIGFYKAHNVRYLTSKQVYKTYLR